MGKEKSERTILSDVVRWTYKVFPLLIRDLCLIFDNEENPCRGCYTLNEFYLYRPVKYLHINEDESEVDMYVSPQKMISIISCD